MSEVVCIQCPMGCRIAVEKKETGYTVKGNACPRGKTYALEELTAPKRIVTCLVKVEGSEEPLSVKTTGGIPKERIFDCVRAIKALSLSSPIRIGTILIEDILGTGVCVVATKTV